MKRRRAGESPGRNVQSAEERMRRIRNWNSVSARSATEIMNTARIICLPIRMCNRTVAEQLWNVTFGKEGPI